MTVALIFVNTTYFKSHGYYFFERITVVAMALFFVLSITSCKRKNNSEIIKSKTEIALGTICTISLFENGTQPLYNKIFTRLNEIESVFSVNLEDSELSKINATAILDPNSSIDIDEVNASSSNVPSSVQISDEMAFVLNKAMFYAKKSEGAFNPAIGPLVSLWGIGTDYARVPSKSEIENILPRCDYKQVFLSEKTDSNGNHSTIVQLGKFGMKLDLGAIVKGYAADEIAKIIRAAGIKSALIDLGGNVYAVGNKADGSLWKIGVKNPSDTSTLAVRIDGHDLSVVTSGVYERVYVSKETDIGGGGISYHHIIDGSTGYPAKSRLLSSTISSFYPDATSIDADALSTTVFILGEKKGLDFLESLNIDGFVITENNNIITTKGYSVAGGSIPFMIF